MNFVEELRWRGMLHDIMPGTEELFNKEVTSVYLGIEPTADSAVILEPHKIKSVTVSIVSPSICHEANFFTLHFHFHQEAF